MTLDPPIVLRRFGDPYWHLKASCTLVGPSHFPEKPKQECVATGKVKVKIEGHMTGFYGLRRAPTFLNDATRSRKTSTITHILLSTVATFDS